MKVNVRRINEWDAPAVLKIYAPYAESGFAPEQAAPTLPEMIQRIDKYTYGYGWLVCELDNVPAGFCYVTEHAQAAQDPFELDFHIYVKPEFQRRRVGTALCSLLFRILEYGNRRTLFAQLPAWNETAAAFLRSQDFAPAASPQNGEILCLRRALSPEDATAERITKPYLIEGKAYEQAREQAQNLVKI